VEVIGQVVGVAMRLRDRGTINSKERFPDSRADRVFRKCNKNELKIREKWDAVGSEYGKSPSRSLSENSRDASYDRCPRSRNLRLLQTHLSGKHFDRACSLLRWRSGRTASGTWTIHSESHPNANADASSNGALVHALVYEGRHPGKEGGP
jgi:hypothetical protein